MQKYKAIRCTSFEEAVIACNHEDAHGWEAVSWSWQASAFERNPGFVNVLLKRK